MIIISLCHPHVAFSFFQIKCLHFSFICFQFVMSRKVFLEIKIGDVEKYDDASRRYLKAKAWVKQWSSTYGFVSDDLDQLTLEDKETAKDILASDPTATSEKWLIDAPEPLKGGRIEIELFDKECPKTCENFVALCQGGKVGKSSKKPLYYKNTRMFRLVSDFIVQGGDVTRGIRYKNGISCLTL